jgi:hypothetical protein
MMREMGWAWQLSGVTPLAKLVALYLGDLHGTIPASTISVAKVAAFCGVEENEIVDDPQTYFAGVLTRLVNLWPASRLDELMPWAWAAERSVEKLAA